MCIFPEKKQQMHYYIKEVWMSDKHTVRHQEERIPIVKERAIEKMLTIG